MKNRKSFTCYLIGTGNLLLECAQILLARSVEIKGIITPSVTIRQWAANNGIPSPDNLAQSDWHTESIDYLFNLGSDEIISEEILQKVFYLTVHFHDSLLPKYAGAHPGSWAILNHEPVHGITWHVLDGLVNGGDILKQVSINISPDDTAISLKNKCVQLAISSFPDLVSSLHQLDYSATPQDLSLRSCFTRSKKPPGNGCIAWSDRAEDIHRLWRATRFGDDRNTFGLAKMLVANAMFVVNAIHLLTWQSVEPPGSVIEIGDDYLIVSTSSANMRIAKISDAYGNEVPIRKLVKQFSIRPGYQLISMTQEDQMALAEIAQRNCRYEQLWVEKLAKFEPTPATLQEHGLSVQNLPRSLYYRCLDFSRGAAEAPLVFLAAWTIYLHRLGNLERVALWVCLPETELPANLRPFFSCHIPISIEINDQENFSQVIVKLRDLVADLTRLKTFQNDIWQRYPELRMASRPGQCSYTVDLAPDGHVADGTGQPLPESFTSLFAQLLLHAETAVEKVNWLSLIEEQLILQTWNATGKSYPEHKTIHRLFEEQAHLNPDDVALIDQDYLMSYRELNGRVNQLANYLKTYQGIKPDQRVVVCLEPGHHLVMTLLGILKAGAAYMPVDPDDSIQKIKCVLSDSNVRLLISVQKFAEKFRFESDSSANQIKVLMLDSAGVLDKLHTLPDANPRTSMTSEQLAYVLRLTDMTTEVEIQHRSLVNQICWLNSTYPLHKTDRILQRASLASGVLVWELFWAAGCGAPIVLSNPDRRHDLNYLIDLMVEQSVTIVQFTSEELRELMRSLSVKLSRLKNLRHVFCIGEVLNTSTVNGIKRILPDVEIHNLYGLAERGMTAFSHDCTDPMEAVIGKPIANIRAYVLDHKLRPMPIGVPGELYVAGIGLTPSDTRRGGLIEEKLIANPFQDFDDNRAASYQRLYRTGNRARWLLNGNLQLLSRDATQTGFKAD